MSKRPSTQKTTKSRPQAALTPQDTFLQLLPFKEEEILAEFGRQAAGIAGQNMNLAAAEVEEDLATIVAAIRDNATMMLNPDSKNTEGNNDSN